MTYDQIEFRGLRVDCEKWVYGLPYRKSEFGPRKIVIQDDKGILFYVVPSTITMWSTIIDDYENKIFQGDMIDDHGVLLTGEVEFKDGIFGVLTLESMDFIPLSSLKSRFDGFVLEVLGTIRDIKWEQKKQK